MIDNHNAVDTRAAFDENGFCLIPQGIEGQTVQSAIPDMDAVMMGEYETGVAPFANWKPGDDETKIRKIDQVHLSNQTLFELITHPAIGEWAAAITGAKMVQVWALQMLYKPPGGAGAGGIGWHQDWQYWKDWWQEGSEVFTAWLAVSDVREESGPMKLVSGSHRWGFLDQGNFFDGELEREQITVPPGETWQEVSAVLPPGGLSFHHRFTYHGSGPNISNLPRRAFAIHLRTEKSAPVPGSTEYFVSHLDDERMCPTIYGG